MPVPVRISFLATINRYGDSDRFQEKEINGKTSMVYTHIVSGQKIWFAYDLPYTPEHMEKELISEIAADSNMTVLELCRTKKNRPVKAIRFQHGDQASQDKLGIWLQARAHAFETGGSWVVHELARWLMSDDPDAVALVEKAVITVIPIIEVDGVIEGRTGKNQKPYDPNRGWDQEPGFWPQTRKIKTMLREMADQNQVDLFIDFHGPGQLSHPYFIVPVSEDLPFEKQRINRANFFRVLEARELTDSASQTQSMTGFHYSPRTFAKGDISSSSKWVTHKTNEHTLALTIKVNMNTPLSAREGYCAEGIALGKGIAKYICRYHQR